MQKQHSSVNKEPAAVKTEQSSHAFKIMSAATAAVVLVSLIIISQYRPGPAVPPAPPTFEQKMAHLETGAPLPAQAAAPEVPRWMMALVLGFVVVQVLPLLLAAHKARAKGLTMKDLREIEFLAETPLHLGLLGSLLGVCMTQFISGTLAAPLAYLTTISGILLYLFGRFTVLVYLPPASDYN